jgi:hypothetical protein
MNKPQAPTAKKQHKVQQKESLPTGSPLPADRLFPVYIPKDSPHLSFLFNNKASVFLFKPLGINCTFYNIINLLICQYIPQTKRFT